MVGSFRWNIMYMGGTDLWGGVRVCSLPLDSSRGDQSKALRMSVTSSGHHAHTFISCKINIFKEKETVLQRGEWRKQIFCMILLDIWLHSLFF